MRPPPFRKDKSLQYLRKLTTPTTPGRLDHQQSPRSQKYSDIQLIGPLDPVVSGGGADDGGPTSSRLTRVTWRMTKDLMVSVTR